MGPVYKKRKVVTAKVEEVNFDDTARQEWLTGFRKRKLQRIKQAQEVAEKKYKEEKRSDRKRVCVDCDRTALHAG
jgi:ribosomal RNA-processing protein 17